MASSLRSLLQDIPSLREWGLAVSAVAAAVLIARGLSPWLAEPDQVMIFLFAVLFVAYRERVHAALLCALLGVAAFDFFFVDPLYTFVVSSSRYLLTFLTMALLGVLSSTLVWKLRAQAAQASAQRQLNAQLFALSTKLSSAQDTHEIFDAATRELAKSFGVAVATYEAQGRALTLVCAHGELERHPGELIAAQWALDHAQEAGRGTQTLSTHPALYKPLHGQQGRYGVIGLYIPHHDFFSSPERQHLLEMMFAQIVQALDRAALVDSHRAATLRLESEQLRSSLLSSISHDLRTPVASILGGAETLLSPPGQLGVEQQRHLIQGMYEEADRLKRQLNNVLDMTRIEGGGVLRQWFVPEETIGVALKRCAQELQAHHVITEVDVELAHYEESCVLSALINLLHNAALYCPPSTQITVRAHQSSTHVIFEVCDRGQGVEPQELGELFDKFYRGRSSQGKPGSGLGLAIVNAVAKLHGGQAWAKLRPDGPGLCIGFELERAHQPPTMDF